MTWWEVLGLPSWTGSGIGTVVVVETCGVMVGWVVVDDDDAVPLRFLVEARRSAFSGSFR